MAKEKQEKASKNQSQHTRQRDSQDTEQLFQQRIGSDQSNLIGQRISRITNIPSITAHAAMLNRAPAKQQSANRQLLLHLQRQYGNRYVQRVVQQAGQQNQPVIQTKLTLGAVGDKYEREADRVAKQVVNTMSTTSHQPVQKMERDEDELAQMKPDIQRMAVGEATEVDPSVEDAIQRARGRGQPLAENVRVPMEQAFRADFSRVRVHTDSRSHQLNQSIQARAFTTGQNVFFRQGEYNPVSRGGQELLAHELTHVVQQAGQTVHAQQESGWARKSHQGLLSIQRVQKNDIQTNAFPGKNVGIIREKVEKVDDRNGHTYDKHVKQEGRIAIYLGTGAGGPDLQRAVPKDGKENKKPIPETGNYTSKASEREVFDNSKHPRSAMGGFSSAFRLDVLKKYILEMPGNQPLSVRTASGVQANVEGVQLDHQISWAKISEAMQARNNQAKKYGGWKYSLWDARMYYHDITNLVPELGNINAAAGTSGVRVNPSINEHIANAIGTVQSRWQNLQAGITAVGKEDNLTEQRVTEIVLRLLGLGQMMNQFTDELFDGRNAEGGNVVMEDV